MTSPFAPISLKGPVSPSPTRSLPNLKCSRSVKMGPTLVELKRSLHWCKISYWFQKFLFYLCSFIWKILCQKWLLLFKIFVDELFVSYLVIQRRLKAIYVTPELCSACTYEYAVSWHNYEDPFLLLMCWIQVDQLFQYLNPFWFLCSYQIQWLIQMKFQLSAHTSILIWRDSVHISPGFLIPFLHVNRE